MIRFRDVPGNGKPDANAKPKAEDGGGSLAHPKPPAKQGSKHKIRNKPAQPKGK